MKFTVGLLVASLAVCLISADVPIDREYRYRYTSRSFTGLAGDIKQFAGFGMKADLIIQNQGDHYTVKLDNMEGGPFNDQVNLHMDEEFPIRYDKFESRFGVIEEALRQPIRVTYEKGLVKSFDHTPEDTEYSLNFKKALMSLFQLNLERVNPVRSSKSNQVKPDVGKHENFFTVMEDGISGECETVYEIAKHPYHKRPHERVLNVTKHRRHDRCNGRRPIVFQSTHPGHKCEDCKRIEALQVTSRTEYQIHGDEYYHTVEKISNVGTYTFAPLGSKSSTAWSGVNQTLELISTSPIKEPITWPTEYLTSDSLKFKYNEFGSEEDDAEQTSQVDLHKPNYYYRADNYNFNTYKQYANDYLEYLAAKIDVTDDNDDHHFLYPNKFHLLVKVLGTMSFDELKSLYDEHLSYDFKTASEEQQNKKKVFWDAMSTVGTNPTVAFSIYALKQKLLPTKAAGSYFAKMPHYVKDHSESLVQHFLEYTEQIDKENDRQHYQFFWLNFGSLVNHGCQYDHTLISSEHHLRPKTCDKYVELVFDHFEKATTAWEQTLFLKVASNIGLPQIAEHLKPIVTGERIVPHDARRAAFPGYMSATMEHRDEVLAVTVPLFYNHSEPTDIRVIAFEMIMLVNPSYEGLQSIGDRLKDEHNMQVASYVYSAFRNLANSTNPCKKELGQKLRRVLQNIPEYFYGYHYGQRLLFGYFNDKYQFGSELTLAYIGSNESTIPETIYIEKNFDIMGYSIPLLNAEYNGNLLGRLYDQLFGIDGLLTSKDEKKSIYNIVRRRPRNVNTNEKEMDEITDALHIEERKPTPIHGDLAVWTFGQEHGYYHLDKTLPTHSHDGYFYLPKELPKLLQDGIKLNTHKTIIAGDITYMLPNDMGLPLSLSLRSPIHAFLRGDIKLQVEPEFFPEDRDFKKPTNVKLSVDTQAAFYSQAFMNVEIKTPIFFSYGLGVVHQMSDKFPLKVSVDYDTTEKKLHVNYKPTDKRYMLTKVVTHPFTYIDNRTNFLLPVEESPVDKTNGVDWIKSIHFNSKPTTLEANLGQDYLGVGVHYEETNEYPWSSFGAAYKFFGSFFMTKSRTFESNPYNYNIVQRIVNAWQHLHEYFALSPQIVPLNIRLYFEPSKQNPTTEFDLTLDFDKYAKTATINKIPPLTAELTVDADSTYRKVREVHAELVAKGNTERNYKLHWSKSHDHNEIPRKVVMEYERSPIPNYDANPFKVCARGSAKVPEYDQWYSFDKDTEKKVEVSYNLNFGKDCTSESKIDINVVIERTDEQKEQDEHDNVPHYRECQKDSRNGYNVTSEHCWLAVLEYYKLKKYTVDIHYEKLSDEFKSWADEMSHWVKYYWFTNIDHVEKNPNNPANHIKLIGNYSTDEPARLDLEVHRPDLNIEYKDIYYPQYYPFYQHVNTRYSQWNQLKDVIFKYRDQPICHAGKDRFMTFDFFQYQFKAPAKNYYVMGKDCTKKNRFMVLAQDIEHSTYQKAIKVFVLGTKIEILPLDDSSPLVVRVDDVVKPMKQRSVFLYPDANRPGKALFKIIKTGPQYVIWSKRAGLEIVYNGNYVVIWLSNQYRGKTCGLCSNSDGEVIDEFVGPKGCVYNDEQAFGYSWVLPSGTWTAPANLDKTCFWPHEPKYAGKCTLQRNRVIHDVDNIDGKPTKTKNVCFSTQTVPECAPGCRVANGQYAKKKVSFHCLPAQDATTANLIGRVNNLQSLPELEKKSQDYSEVIQYPEECVKA